MCSPASTSMYTGTQHDAQTLSPAPPTPPRLCNHKDFSEFPCPRFLTVNLSSNVCGRHSRWSQWGLVVSCLLLFEQAALHWLHSWELLFSSHLDFSMFDCFANFYCAKKAIRNATDCGRHIILNKSLLSTDQDGLFNFSSRTFFKFLTIYLFSSLFLYNFSIIVDVVFG